MNREFSFHLNYFDSLLTNSNGVGFAPCRRLVFPELYLSNYVSVDINDFCDLKCRCQDDLIGF